MSFVEKIRALELGLQELPEKLQSRLDLVLEDLKSLISDIETLKTSIDTERRRSADLTRDVSDLQNDLQTIKSEILQIERDIENSQSEVDSQNLGMQEINAELHDAKNKLNIATTEKSGLEATLQELTNEETGLQRIHDEFEEKFRTEVEIINSEYQTLKTKYDGLEHKFNAMRTLCSRDYLQTPEVNIVKFLAMKPSSSTNLTEIRAALGVDPNALTKVLSGLASRSVLEFDQGSGNVNITTKIDIFDSEQ